MSARSTTSGVDDDEAVVDVCSAHPGPRRRIGDDDVFEAGAPLPGEVDAGLDRERVARRERLAVAADDVRVLVLLDADAVTGAMDEVRPVARRR